jgi:hypothetical protein
MKAIKTREEWLNTILHKNVAPLLARHGATVPKDCKVSVGFPGGGSARKRIGECWPRNRSSIKVNEIFLNPSVKDAKRLVDILIHEAIHASDDCASGHKGHFMRVAKSVGFEGKMTATTAGPELSKWIDVQIASMPKFEYGSLDLSGRKRQTTRMVKHECVPCGAVWRAAAKWGDSECCPFCSSAMYSDPEEG